MAHGGGKVHFTQTQGWKNLMAKLYGWGAAVVIIGALFKIMHWPFAGLMLIIGLGTEAVIFFFSALEPVHDEIDWTLVYPELGGYSDGDEIPIHDKTKVAAVDSSKGNSLLKFDEMLEKAGGASLFEKIGGNLEKLNTSVTDLSKVSSVTVATNEFAANVKTASDSVANLGNTYKKSAETFEKNSGSLTYSVETLADAYNKSSQKVTEQGNNFVTAYKKLTENMTIDFTALKSGNKEYSDKVGTLNKNLAALNAIFEMQLNETDLDKMMSDIQGSVENSRKYNAEVVKLGNRLEALNNVYGNMLAAMNVKVDK